MEDQKVELTLEQQLAHEKFKRQVALMSREQAQEFCIKLHHLTLAQTTTFLSMNKWGNP